MKIKQHYSAHRIHEKITSIQSLITLILASTRKVSVNEICNTCDFVRFSSHNNKQNGRYYLKRRYQLTLNLWTRALKYKKIAEFGYIRSVSFRMIEASFNPRRYNDYCTWYMKILTIYTVSGYIGNSKYVFLKDSSSRRPFPKLRPWTYQHPYCFRLMRRMA